MQKGVWTVFIVFLLVSCAPAKEFPVGSYQPTTVISKDKIRPHIDRELPPSQPTVNEYLPPEEPPSHLESLAYGIESYDLRAVYNQIIGVDQSLGQTPILFSKYQFPDLLRSRNVRGGIEPIGGTYEQFLRFIGGRPMFTENEDDRVGDYLVYRDEEPIFEYELHFLDGSFLDFIDEEIWILNNPYIIKDANKKHIVLEQTDAGDTIVMGAGPVMINGEVLQDTDSRMHGNSLFLVAKASAAINGDDIFISPRRSLQEYLGEPNMLTDLLDIRFGGVSIVPTSEIFFKNIDKEIEVRFISPLGLISRIPLAHILEGGWRLGDSEGTMFISESSNKSDFKVKQGDYVVLSPSVTKSTLYQRASKNQTGEISAVMQYRKINDRENYVELVSKEGGTVQAYYSETNGEGSVYFAGRSFSFIVGNATDGYPMVVDLNGDDRFTGANVDIVVDDALLDLPSKEFHNESANFTLTLLNFERYGFTEETITLQINPNPSELSITVHSDFDIYDSEQGDNKEYISEFGTHYLFIDQKGKDTFEGISINHPTQARYAKITLEAR